MQGIYDTSLVCVLDMFSLLIPKWASHELLLTVELLNTIYMKGLCWRRPGLYDEVRKDVCLIYRIQIDYIETWFSIVLTSLCSRYHAS